MRKHRLLLAPSLLFFLGVCAAFSASLPPEITGLLVICNKAGTPPATVVNRLQELVNRNDPAIIGLFREEAIRIGGGPGKGDTFMKKVFAAVDECGLTLAEKLAAQAADEVGDGVEAVIRTGSSGDRHMNLKKIISTEGRYSILTSDDDISFLGPRGEEAAEKFNELKALNLKNARCKGFALSPIADATSYDLMVKQIKDPEAFVGAAGFGKIKQEMLEKGGAIILQREGKELKPVAITIGDYIEKNAGGTLAQLMDVAQITSDLKKFGPLTMYASCARQMSHAGVSEREKVKYLLRIYAAMEAAGSFQDAAALGSRHLPGYFQTAGNLLAKAYADKTGQAATKLLSAIDVGKFQVDAFEAVMLGTCGKMAALVRQAESEAGRGAVNIAKHPELRRMIHEMAAGFSLLQMTGHGQIIEDVIPSMLKALGGSVADNTALLYKVLYTAAIDAGTLTAEAAEEGISRGVSTWVRAGSSQGLVDGMKEAGATGKKTRLLLAEVGGERLAGTKAGEGAKQLRMMLEQNNGDSFIWKMLNSETGQKFAVEAIANAPFVMYAMYTEWQKGEMKDLSDAAFVVIEFVPMGNSIKKFGCEGMTAGTVLMFAKEGLYFTPAWPLVLAGDVLVMAWTVGGAVQMQSESEGLVDLLVYNGTFDKEGDAYTFKQLDLPGGTTVPRDILYKWMFETKYVKIKTANAGLDLRINNLSEKAFNVFDSYYLANDPALAQMRAAAQSHLDAINWSEASGYFGGGYLIWMGGFEYIVNNNKDQKWAKLYESLKGQVEKRKDEVQKDWMVPQLIALAEKKYATLNAENDLALQLEALQAKLETLRGSPLGVDLAAKVTEQANALGAAEDNLYAKVVVGVKDTQEKKLMRGEYWQKAFATYKAIYDKNVNIPGTLEARTGYGHARVLHFVWTGEFESDFRKSEQSRAGFAAELSHITADIAKIKGEKPTPEDSVDKQAFDYLARVVFPWRQALDASDAAAPREGAAYFAEYETALEKVRALYGQNKDFNELLKKGTQLVVNPAPVAMDESAEVELRFLDKTLAREYEAGGLTVTWSGFPAGRFNATESDRKTRFSTARPEPVLLTATVDRTGLLKGRGRISRLVAVTVPAGFLSLEINPLRPPAKGEFTAYADVPERFYGKAGKGFHYRWSAEACKVENKDSTTVKGTAPAAGKGSVQVELWVNDLNGKPVVLARRKADVSVQNGPQALALDVKGPAQTPVKSSVAATASLKARDPLVARMAATVVFEWLENGKIIATGPRWVPDTSRARQYRLTVQGVIGAGKTKQVLAAAAYRLDVTDAVKPDEMEEEEEPEGPADTKPSKAAGVETATGSLKWVPANPCAGMPVIFKVHFNKKAAKPFYYWFVDNDYKADLQTAHSKDPEYRHRFDVGGTHTITCVLYDDANPFLFNKKEGLGVCQASVTLDDRLKVEIKSPAAPVVGNYIEAGVTLDPEIAADAGSYLWSVIPAETEVHFDRWSDAGTIRTAVPVMKQQLLVHNAGAVKVALTILRRNSDNLLGIGYSDPVKVENPAITYSGEWTKKPTGVGFFLNRAPFSKSFGSRFSDFVGVDASIHVQLGQAGDTSLEVEDGATKAPFVSGYYKGEMTKSYKEDPSDLQGQAIYGEVEVKARFESVGLWITGSMKGFTYLDKMPEAMELLRVESKKAYEDMLKTINSLQIQAAAPGDTNVSAGELEVRLEADATSLLPGEKAVLKAFASGGQAPYAFAWQGHSDTGADPASATVLGDKEGEKTITVTVADGSGKSVSKSATITVGPLTVLIKKTAPQTDTICVGGEAAFVAEIGGADKDRTLAADYKLQWQPHPEVTFAPQESQTGDETTATFTKLGKTAVWVDVLARKQGAWVKIGESQQIQMDIVAPEFKLEFAPAAPYVGQEITARLACKPELDADLLDIRWLPPPANARQVAAEKPDEMKFYATDDRPVKIESLILSKTERDDLGKAEGTITAKLYEVKVSAPKRLGPVPRVWKEGVGLVEVPDAVATFQDVTVSASIAPEPPGQPLRYQWTVTPEGCALSSPFSRDTRANASQKGAYQATVRISDKDGIALGTGSGSIAVTVSQDDQKEGTKTKPAADASNDLIAKAGKARQLLAEGYELEKKGDLANAVAKYREARTLKDDPKVAVHIAELEKKAAALAQATERINEGYALEKAGKLTEAIAKYRASLALNDQPGVRKHLAEVEAMASNKAKADNWIAKGYNAEKAKNWTEAVTCYESAQKAYSNPKVGERIAYVKKQMQADAAKPAIPSLPVASAPATPRPAKPPTAGAAKPPATKAPPPAKPAPAPTTVPQTKTPMIRSLTGVFRGTLKDAGESITMTLTLRQDGNRVTGRMITTDALNMDVPFNAALRGNRLIPDATDGGDDEPGGAIIISPDRNSITLHSPDGAFVLKRVN
ncbi:MAG: hypothetical protein R6X19_05205 [Kiritimatiellia bacterium]